MHDKLEREEQLAMRDNKFRGQMRTLSETTAEARTWCKLDDQASVLASKISRDKQRIESRPQKLIETEKQLAEAKSEREEFIDTVERPSFLSGNRKAWSEKSKALDADVVEAAKRYEIASIKADPKQIKALSEKVSQRELDLRQIEKKRQSIERLPSEIDALAEKRRKKLKHEVMAAHKGDRQMKGSAPIDVDDGTRANRRLQPVFSAYAETRDEIRSMRQLEEDQSTLKRKLGRYATDKEIDAYQAARQVAEQPPAEQKTLAATQQTTQPQAPGEPIQPQESEQAKSAREKQEFAVSNKFFGVPMSFEDFSSIQRLPREEQNLEKAKRQLDFIKSPSAQTDVSAEKIRESAFLEAKTLDPGFVLGSLSEVSEYMGEVRKRERSVQWKSEAGISKLLPLRRSDVILLRAESEIEQGEVAKQSQINAVSASISVQDNDALKLPSAKSDLIRNEDREQGEVAKHNQVSSTSASISPQGTDEPKLLPAKNDLIGSEEIEKALDQLEKKGFDNRRVLDRWSDAVIAPDKHETSRVDGFQRQDDRLATKQVKSASQKAPEPQKDFDSDDWSIRRPPPSQVVEPGAQNRTETLRRRSGQRM